MSSILSVFAEIGRAKSQLEHPERSDKEHALAALEAALDAINQSAENRSVTISEKD